MGKNINIAVWASPHNPTKEQLESLSDGYTNIVYLKDINADLFQKICNSPSNTDGLFKLADDLISFISDYKSEINADNLHIVQPAGSPAFQYILGRLTSDEYINVVYAHSERVSVDEVQEDGSIKKTSVFKHKNWIVI